LVFWEGSVRSLDLQNQVACVSRIKPIKFLTQVELIIAEFGEKYLEAKVVKNIY
jgi:hypothetical protein